MHILIAPNAFKNALPAGKAAAAMEEGLRQSHLRCTTCCFPVGDGGDGTGELIIQHCRGTSVRVRVNDPLGRKINASYGLIDDERTAVIEMADASGLRLLKTDELHPLRTTSFGTGELILNALNKKVNKIILCIGGSATVDGGVGVLQALGFEFIDKYQKQLKSIPESLVDLGSINSSFADARINACELVILCDVENYLLGERGAAAVFGPQKGAAPADVKKLEVSLSRLRNVVLKQTGKDMAAMKHGGAAGGVAAGLAAMLNAQLVKGADHFLSLTGFDKELDLADIVVTGEGSIDIQTLNGKAPYEVARRAKEKGKQVIGFTGKLPDKIPVDLKKHFDRLILINQQPVNLSEALQNTKANLVTTAKNWGDSIASLK